MLLGRINELVQSNRDFAFETTLAGRGYLQNLRELREKGYRIVLFFLWLPDANMAVARVINRVRQGGHNVPESIVRRRYSTGIKNLFHLYQPLADAWWLYDASRLPPVVIAQVENSELAIYDMRC